MTRFKAFIIVLSLFLISILLRLPNLNRTISKHHEFNTAVVLINIQSWRQAGGGSKFNFVPLLNFQNPGDKLVKYSHYFVDSAGNVMYLSFGPGWYVIPYFFYQLFNWPVKPIYLQIINLIFNLASVILFFRLLELLISSENQKKYLTIAIGCFFFIYAPATLWYFGNGYINIGIMMPFVIVFFLLLIPMLQSAQNITAGKLFLLGALIILLIYFDWFILAACAVVGIGILFKLKKNKKYFWLLLAIGIFSITGIALLFWQFASYAGWQAVTAYWSHRFNNRSFVNTETSFWTMSRYFIKNFITSYLPLFLMLIVAFVRAWSKKIKFFFSENEILFIKIYTATVVLYNLALFEWSYEHEFSVIPWSILFSYLAAKSMVSVSAKKQLQILIPLFFVVTMSQYYLMNRPGKISRGGTPYIIFKTFGEALRQVPPDYKIFLSAKQDPMVEYYAGRNINSMPGIEEAKKYMQRWGIQKAVWIEHENFELKKITIISPVK